MDAVVDAGAVVLPAHRTFARERATPELCQEILPLLVGHYSEVANFKDIKINPDFDQYIKIDELGMLRIFTAREEGAMIGYAVYFVRESVHHISSLQATQDGLYIAPDKRGFGMEFIAWCDAELRDEGVEVIYQTVKANRKHDFSKMLIAMGYKLTDKIYGRRL